jgi:PleD family two-component response regulator
VSVGVAASEPHMTASELILRADQALYVAKRAGRNRVRTFIAEPCVR